MAPSDTLEKVAALADETVCLEVPDVFFAVGQFFRNFDQVEDDEVTTLLRKQPPTGAP